MKVITEKELSDFFQRIHGCKFTSIEIFAMLRNELKEIPTLSVVTDVPKSTVIDPSSKWRLEPNKECTLARFVSDDAKHIKYD